LATNSDLPNRIGTLFATVLDVSDLERSTQFWLNVFGGDKIYANPIYTRIGDTNHQPTLLLQKVPEVKSVKNRAHLDFEIDDLDTSVEQVIQLGGTEVSRITEYGLAWPIMADPDGNEFCLITKPE
jgi:predicted enzyme related to lactoylglutathione lyase